MFKLWQRIFTKNLKEIPLLYINFNFKQFKLKGKKDSCMLHVHPMLRYDDHIKETLNDLVEYIRENYDMNEI